MTLIENIISATLSDESRSIKINNTFQKYEICGMQIQCISDTCKYHKQNVFGVWKMETTMTCNTVNTENGFDDERNNF